MHPAILIYNPKAGRWRNARLVHGLVTELATDDLAIEPVATRAPGDATTLARQAAEAGAPMVVALGGDGTLREVAAGLLGTDCVLAPLPGGTTNVIAGALGIPSDPRAAARHLKTLPALDLDVGLCGEEIFLMQASMGLDGRALADVSPRLKRWLGRAAVGFAALAAWWRYDYPEFELLLDGHPVHATFAAVCNLPLYGGMVALVPQARPDDGRLDVLLFRGRGRRATFDFGRDLWRGRHLTRSDVSVLQAEEVVVTGIDVPLQIDGDSRPWRLGIEIRLASEKLRILGTSSIISRR